MRPNSRLNGPSTTSLRATVPGRSIAILMLSFKLKSFPSGMTLSRAFVWAGTIPSVSWAQGPAAAGASAKAKIEFPKDVDPNSGFRLPLPKWENMDEYGKKVMDKFVDPGARLLAGLRGPSGIRLYSPKVAWSMR